MTLDALNQRASISGCKKRTKTKGCGYPVKITKVSYPKSAYGFRPALDMFEEPRNCHFKDTAYWQVVWCPNEMRAYVIYSDAKKGYKVGSRNNKIGRVEWSDDAFAKALIDYSDEKTMFFNWKWDNECARAYIDLGGKD